MAELLNKIPTNLTEYPNSFKRQGAFPLEAYSVFYATETKTALEAAQDYAANNGIAYVGQTLAVVDVSNKNIETVTLYIISDAAGTLQEVGRATEGDNVSIALNDGVLSLAGFAAAGNATLPQKTPVYKTDAEGNPTNVVDHYELAWKSIDAIVEGDTNTKTVVKTADDSDITITHEYDEANDINTYTLDLKLPVIPEYAITKVRDDVNKLTTYTLTKDNSDITESIVVYDAYDDSALSERLDAVEETNADHETRLGKVENFFKVQEGESLNQALDTLKEIQDYLDGDGTAADDLLSRTAANKAAIDILNGEGEGSVSKAIDDAITAQNTTIASTYATSDELDAVAETANAAAKATEVTQALADKADKADLAGYRTIADSYSTSQIDNLLAGIRGEYGETADSVAAELDAHKEANIASFAAIETKQGAQDNAIQANKTAIDAINDKTNGILAQALAGSSDATDAKINTLKETELAALDDRLTAAESDIDTLQSTTGTLSGSVTTIEGNVTDLQGRVSTLETDTGTLVSRVDAHDTSIGELNTAQQTLSDEIDALGTKFDDYSTTTAVETKISEAVATLENGKVAGNTTAIETEASRAVAKETELAGLIQGNTDSIQSLSDEFDALESVLNSVIENEDSTALNSIKELASWIEQHGKEASEMTASITANTNAIAVLNGTGEGSVKHIVDTAIENIPAATTNTLGLVKVGTTLTISNDGLLDVDYITTDQLTQGSNTLVLNGGSATQK